MAQDWLLSSEATELASSSRDACESRCSRGMGGSDLGRPFWSGTIRSSSTKTLGRRWVKEEEVVEEEEEEDIFWRKEGERGRKKE